jgi:hypothetical protein
MAYPSAPTNNNTFPDYPPPTYSKGLHPSGPTYGSSNVTISSLNTYGYTTSPSASLEQLFSEYSFAGYVLEDFSAVRNFDIIVICDNSMSMQGSRWNKLKEHIKLIVRFAVAIDDDGIDIIFLNPQKTFPDTPAKKEFNNITTSDGVEMLFHEKPDGFTPLSDTLTYVMNKPSEKKKIIFILTDGKPYASDDRGNRTDSEQRFSQVIHNRNSDQNRIVIMLCVDGEEDAKVVDYYDCIDKSADKVEVLHVYSEEREQVLAVQGNDFIYSLNDHIARMFLSPIFDEYDKLDEKKLKMTPDGRFNRNMSIKKKTNTHRKDKNASCILM